MKYEISSKERTLVNWTDTLLTVDDPQSPFIVTEI